MERRIKWLKTRATNLRKEAFRCLEQRKELESYYRFTESDELFTQAEQLEKAHAQRS